MSRNNLKQTFFFTLFISLLFLLLLIDVLYLFALFLISYNFQLIKWSTSTLMNATPWLFFQRNQREPPKEPLRNQLKPSKEHLRNQQEPSQPIPEPELMISGGALSLLVPASNQPNLLLWLSLFLHPLLCFNKVQKLWWGLVWLWVGGWGVEQGSGGYTMYSIRFKLCCDSRSRLSRLLVQWACLAAAAALVAEPLALFSSRSTSV